MLLKGEWLLCGDGVMRPVLHGEAEARDGSWAEVNLLVDTGADRTVFSAAALLELGLEPLDVAEGLTGVGGRVSSVVVETRIQFTREDGVPIILRGRYAGTTDPDTLDMSVLGRDIMNHFALIVDRPGDTVCLLGQAHRYVIEQR
jgi:hypothetical protein